MSTIFDLILRSRPEAGVSKDVATWFETRSCGALLTMRIEDMAATIRHSQLATRGASHG